MPFVKTTRRPARRYGGKRHCPQGEKAGRAEDVADDLIAWVEETDIDGFNLSRIVTPESLEDFVDLVVPILQERGAYKHDYLPGSLREKLFGHSPLLPPSHPAAAHRQRAGNSRQSR
jgi:long-chain alkane monooxygenase